VIALLKGEPRLHARAPAEVGLSAIVMHELFFGEGLRLEVVPFDADDARVSGAVSGALAAAGPPIGAYDVLIAGQALARG
jgi:tRNA(fMet)-specific endonuclease VapC